MTRILGSVRNLQEAQLLFAAAIDILDLKEPDRGALGAVDLSIVRATAQWVRGRRQVSAAAGTADEPGILTQAQRLSSTGVDFVKAGFAAASQQPLLAQLCTAVEPPARIVAVLFADCPSMDPMQWIGPARTAGCAGLMLDTADKRSGPLTRHLAPSHAQAWVQAARHAGLLCGLAGRLDLEAARQYLPAGPDYLGFRSALCDQARRINPVCPDTARRLLQSLRTANHAASSPLRTEKPQASQLNDEASEAPNRPRDSLTDSRAFVSPL